MGGGGQGLLLPKVVVGGASRHPRLIECRCAAWAQAGLSIRLLMQIVISGPIKLGLPESLSTQGRSQDRALAAYRFLILLLTGDIVV